MSKPAANSEKWMGIKGIMVKDLCPWYEHSRSVNKSKSWDIKDENVISLCFSSKEF